MEKEDKKKTIRRIIEIIIIIILLLLLLKSYSFFDMKKQKEVKGAKGSNIEDKIIDDNPVDDETTNKTDITNEEIKPFNQVEKVFANNKNKTVDDKKQLKATFVFIGNNGKEYKEEKCTINGDSCNVSAPNVPDNMVGTKFSHWSSDESDDVKIEDFNLTEDKKYYAIYEKSVSLKYDSNGGNETFEDVNLVLYYNASGGLLTNNEITLEKNITKNNYKFKGWEINSYTYNDKYNLQLNVVAKAKWADLYNTVTFDAGIGSVTPSDKQVENGTKIGVLPNPTVSEEYEFLGWYIDNNEIDKNYIVEQNVTVIAKYKEKKYTITFDSNGGPTIDPVVVRHNDTITKPNNPTKEGYNFIKWLDGTNEYDFTKPVKSDKALKAQWKIIEYSITYATANGMNVVPPNPTKYTIETETFTLTKPIRVVIKNGVIQNYIFKGWTRFLGDPPVLEVTIPKGSTGNRHYAAEWADAYKVTYNANGGTVSPMSFLVEQNNAIGTLATPTRNHYTFDAWYLGTEKIEEDYIVNQNITIVAKWNKEKYNVSFDTNGGSNIANQIIEYQDKATRPVDDPTKEGYDFINWYKDENYTTVFNFDTQIEEDTVIYAKFEKKNYTVTYNPDGGAVTPSSFTKKYEEEIGNLAVPVKDGYDFDGWFIGSEKIESDYIVKSDITLTAKYTPIIYTITYKLNGGIVTNPATYTVETEDFTLNNAISENAAVRFLGWIGSNGNTPKRDLVIRKGTTGNLNYEAVFGNAYIVTFDVGNGTLNPLPDDRWVAEGDKIGTLPPAPTPPLEHKFEGWYVGDTKIDQNYIVNQDIEVKAGYVYVTLAEEVESLEGEDVTDPGCTISGKTGGVTKTEDPFGNVRYIGACPANYVWYNCKIAPTGDNFDYESNCERWRIIGTFKDIDDGTGNKQDRIKIMRNESLGVLSWDTIASGFGYNQWGVSKYANGNTYEGADLMRELNGDYLNYSNTGTTTWYNGYQNKKTFVYNYSNGLSEYAQSLIDDAIWHIGPVNINNESGGWAGQSLLTTSRVYLNERSGVKPTMFDEASDGIIREVLWTGKVAMISPSDYGYSTNGGTYGRGNCINNDKWISTTSTSPSYNSQCYQNSWIYHMIPNTGDSQNKRIWTFGRVGATSEASYAFIIHKNAGYPASVQAYTASQVFPSVFLGGDVRVTGGTGTYASPFTVDHKKVMINE